VEVVLGGQFGRTDDFDPVPAAPTYQIVAGVGSNRTHWNMSAVAEMTSTGSIFSRATNAPITSSAS